MRIGFIGSGGMADKHLEGLTTFEDVEIAAFCDVVLERAQEQCKKHSKDNPQAFSSPRDMVRNASLDACFILLPPFAHGEPEKACIEGGVPFLVEKPIGKDLALLRELRDEVQSKNLITCAGYMNRFQPSVQRAKEAFTSDTPVLAYGGWLGGPPTTDNAYMANSLIGKWWVQKDKSGGQFVEQVTHTVDLVRYFLGEAVEVFAHSTTAFNKKLPNLLPNYTMDDAMTTSIKFESGALATILAGSATPVGGGISLEILGMNSAVKFRDWGHDVEILRKGENGVESEEVASATDVFAREDRAFLDAIQTGDRSKILSDYDNGFKTAQLALGANQSAETGQPVDLTS